MLRMVRARVVPLAVLLAVVCLAASGCAPASKAGDVQILVDGEAWKGASVSGEAGEGLRVYITLDGKPLLDLPFGEPRRVQIIQGDAGENTVVITEDAVYMEHADCENQDCVQMGAVTRENLELRVMGGFIVCLPHRLSVEVRDG